jgi:hypothetical protein
MFLKHWHLVPEASGVGDCDGEGIFVVVVVVVVVIVVVVVVVVVIVVGVDDTETNLGIISILAFILNFCNLLVPTKHLQNFLGHLLLKSNTKPISLILY